MLSQRRKAWKREDFGIKKKKQKTKEVLMSNYYPETWGLFARKSMILSESQGLYTYQISHSGCFSFVVVTLENRGQYNEQLWTHCSA